MSEERLAQLEHENRRLQEALKIRNRLEELMVENARLKQELQDSRKLPIPRPLHDDDLNILPAYPPPPYRRNCDRCGKTCLVSALMSASVFYCSLECAD